MLYYILSLINNKYSFIFIYLKIAVERSLSSKLEDARDALTNKMIDILGVYKSTLTSSQSGASPQLQICDNLKLLPLLSLGLLKHVCIFLRPD